MNIGQVGIWASPMRRGDATEAHDAAAELEELGFSALWVPGGGVRAPIQRMEGLLRATDRIVLATGVLNTWLQPADSVAAAIAALDDRHVRRLLVGIGVGHRPSMQARGVNYERPLGHMRAYLDRLDTAETPVPAERRILGALGPRMLELAAQRSRGTHPYLVTPEYVSWIRGVVGDHAVVAPMQMVVAAPHGRRRQVARAELQRYLTLPNYARTWRRGGFGAEDLEGGGSNRLVDALFAMDVDAAREKVGEHLAAGADHVCLQVVAEGDQNRTTFPRQVWRALADGLLRDIDFAPGHRSGRPPAFACTHPTSSLTTEDTP